MPDTFTPVLNLTQPEVGASNDSWGTKLNADLATLDALFATTGSGTLVRRDASDSASTVGVVVDKAAGNGRWLKFRSAGSDRWFAGANTVAEGGSNAGSDWNLQRYSDAAALLGTPLAIARATGQVTFETTPQVGTNAVFHAGNSGSLNPLIGQVSWWAGSGDPAGGFWIAADGRALDRTVYATLFAATGTAYGAGNGTTTFNIPNLQERVIVGKSSAQTLIPQFDARVLGGTFGEGKHTMVTAEMPSHTHAIADHNHAVHAAGQGGASGSAFTALTGFAPADSINAGTTDNATLAPAVMGGDVGHNNVQPSIVLTPVIRVL